MGREAGCLAEIGEWMGEGKLLLETDDLIFRGARRFSLPLAELRGKVVAAAGWLEVPSPEGLLRFDLGNAADRWAHAINHPRTLMDKLDVKPGHVVSVLGIEDVAFRSQLLERTGKRPGEGTSDLDMVIFLANEPAALDRLAELRGRIHARGAIWVVTPRGASGTSRTSVIRAGRVVGLVDVKTARFSDTHTAVKFVIPKHARPPGP